MAGKSNNVVSMAPLRARAKVVNHFAALHAITPEDAIEYAPPGPAERREFETLARRGIIRQREPGAYWIDLNAHDAEADRRRRRRIPVVLAVTMVLIWGLMMFYRG